MLPSQQPNTTRNLRHGIPVPLSHSVHRWNVEQVCKRDGRMAPFDQERIVNAIFRAAKAVGGNDREEAWRISDLVCRKIEELGKRFPTVEEIQDIVEKALIEGGHAKTAKVYILYRAKRAELRAAALEADKNQDTERSAFLKMFAHKSKLVSILGYDRIESYKKILFGLKDLQKQGKIPTHPDYLGGNELATNIYFKKYYLKDLQGERLDKRPEDSFARLASFMAAVEPDEKRQQLWAEEFYRSLYEGHFVPGGRVLAGAGDLYRLKTLANCFVSMILEDNLESIYQAAYECARTYSYGGGIGVDVSVLRPARSVVHNAADESTGAVSFMELYSLTTGLIGQAGRRGALMITMDIKHPDSPLFINVKNIPNWITKQIVEQCKMSGKFSDVQLQEIQRQVRENTQVRHANISLKMNDEFMRAVEEQNEYGPDTILLYEKDKSVSSLGVAQGGGVHYSYGIPCKPIDRYALRGSFSSISELNAFLSEEGCAPLTPELLQDATRRDMFGDFLSASPKAKGDFAIKYAGDFMLYFYGVETGEIKQLVKARELWDAFVKGNYRTAEPGLIFWTNMTRFSPSNYIGRPIVSTNPCVTGDTLISTVEGLLPIRDLVGRRPLLLLDNGMSGRATKVWQTGIKPTYIITTREGFTLKATADHQIQTREGWKPLALLRIGEKIAVGKLTGLRGGEGTYEEGLTLGWLAGDGHYNAKNDGRSILYFYGNDKQECLGMLQQAVAVSTGRTLAAISSGAAVHLKSRGITRLAFRYGVSQGRFPSNVLQMSRECQRGFLQALFTADGSIQGTAEKGYSVRLASSDEEALRKTQLLLLGFGIYSVLYRNRRQAMSRPLPDGHGGRKDYFCKAQHELIVSSASLQLYAEEVGFLSKQKQERLAKAVASFVRGPYRERFEATIEHIEANGTEAVYDLTEPKTHSFIANGIVVHNCGEIPLEDGGACNLGSINLSRFVRNSYSREAAIDWEGIAKTSAVITRFLDNVVTWNETLNALEKQRKAARETRRLGIGVMGIADMLNQLNMGYDSKEGIEVIEQVMRFIANHVYRASASLAEEKGATTVFDYEAYARGEFFKNSLDEETKEAVRAHGLRNIALLSIAPTGTISNIVLSYQVGNKNYIGVSGGIEPIFALYYTRRSEGFGNQIFKVFHSVVDAYIEERGLQKTIQGAHDVEDLKKVLPPHFFRTAHMIAPDKRIEIQAVCQQYVDHSISSTVNLSEDIEPEVISNIYLDAWRKGLKGITIYREGSRFAILTTEGEKTAFSALKDKVFAWDGKEIQGGDVISLPNGRLTTVYHALHYGFMKVTDDDKVLSLTQAAYAQSLPAAASARQVDLSAYKQVGYEISHSIFQNFHEDEHEEHEGVEIQSENALSTHPPFQNREEIGGGEDHTFDKPVVLTNFSEAGDSKENREGQEERFEQETFHVSVSPANLRKNFSQFQPHVSVATATKHEWAYALCPACKEMSLRMENGCNTCMNEACGYGQCEV